MAFRINKLCRWLILSLVLLLIYIISLIFIKNDQFPYLSDKLSLKEKKDHVYASVVLSLSKQTAHIAEFYVLYESWRFIQTFVPLSEEVTIDLIIFCEEPSCSQLPSSCIPLHFHKDFDKTSQCYYEILDPKIVEEWKKYLYMTSIAFMLTEQYQKATSNYQWILRVDQDAVLSPAIYLGLQNQHRIPLYNMQFGAIGHGIDFTHQRLRDIAKKLGYKHAGIHNLCSTWLVSPKDSIILAGLTTKIGKHFLANEYGPKVKGIEDLPYIGEWPKWWLGVTSLYSADIAINDYYFGKLSHQHESSALDHSADSDQSIWNAWHIHCLHNPTEFAKFNHRDRLRDFLSAPQEKRYQLMANSTATKQILNQVTKEFKSMQTNKQNFQGKIAVRDYVTALAWQKAYAAISAVNY